MLRFGREASAKATPRLGARGFWENKERRHRNRHWEQKRFFQKWSMADLLLLGGVPMRGVPPRCFVGIFALLSLVFTSRRMCERGSIRSRQAGGCLMGSQLCLRTCVCDPQKLGGFVYSSKAWRLNDRCFPTDRCLPTSPRTSNIAEVAVFPSQKKRGGSQIGRDGRFHHNPQGEDSSQLQRKGR